MAKPGALAGFGDEVVARLGPVDLWVNNAAVLGPLGPLRDVDLGEVDRAVRINFLGALHGSAWYVDHARHRRPRFDAVLVNVTSRAARRARAGMAAYSASKAALERLTEAIADEESADDYVRVFAVSPGYVDTPAQEAVRSSSVLPGSDANREAHQHGEVKGPEVVARFITGLAFGPAATGGGYLHTELEDP